MSTPVADLLDPLQDRFGLRDFRPSQREVITDVLARRDVLCVMPTGAGKSLCYQLPAVVQGGITLVVSPLISLMEDQVRQLRQRDIDAEFLNSSQNAGQQREVLARVENGYEGLLYVAPERFFAGNFIGFIKRQTVNLLAIDEAHCISQWGHDFRPEYHRLGDVREALEDPVTIALTATATDDVRQDIVRILQLHEPSVYVTGFDRPNLSYESRCVEKTTQKIEMLHDLLRAEPGSSIVYCATRKAVDELTGELSRQFPKRSIFAYHAGMDPAARQGNQERFMRTPGAIAIATNAFGMGINKPDVRLVAHYNTPGTLEAYYQEAGRAGRDGDPSRCVILYHFGDRKTQEFFIGRIGESRDDSHGELDADVLDELKARATAKLDLMVRYARSHLCRRQQILEYFGDESDVVDCSCDVCRGEAGGGAFEAEPMTDETVVLIQKMLSAVARMNGRFGMTAVAEVLAGVSSERTTRWQLDQLSVFGLLREHDPKQLISMLHRLVEAGLARQRDPDNNRRPIIELTTAGVLVMKGKQPPPPPLAGLASRTQRKPTSSRREPASGKSRGGSRGGLVQGASGDEVFQPDATTRERFERLRVMRNQLARDRQLPSYCICHDKTLMLIAHHQPTTPETLEHIKGMGPHKVRMYGQQLLDALRGNVTDREYTREPAEDTPPDDL